MIYLTESSLKYAANISVELPKHKTLIFVQNRLDKEQIFDYLSSIIPFKEVYDYTKSRFDCMIKFFNGSIIRILPANENERGNRGHLVIADKNIPKMIINTIIKPYDTWDYYTQMEDKNEIKSI